VGISHFSQSSFIEAIKNILKMPTTMQILTNEELEKKKSEAQKFLDSNQYSRNGITRYEEIFGKTFVSVGGELTTAQFVARLNLRPGQRVLDVGAGAGGSAFYMARMYDVDVHGMDLSTNMTGIAKEYRNQMEPAVKHRVQFYVEDITQVELPPNFYDVVYSRDTIMHIEDKLTLYKKLLSSLKPGGKLLVSDYTHGDKEHSQRFKAYAAQRNYQLHTVEEYGKILKKAGFDNVQAEDKTDLMLDIMALEMEKFVKIRTSFVKKFSQKDYDDIYIGWKEKVVRCQEGDQTWGLFTATK